MGRVGQQFLGHAAPYHAGSTVTAFLANAYFCSITCRNARCTHTAGSTAELIGPTITIDDVAAAADTISYEILTSLGRRYRRLITDEPTAAG